MVFLVRYWLWSDSISTCNLRINILFGYCYKIIDNYKGAKLTIERTNHECMHYSHFLLLEWLLVWFHRMVSLVIYFNIVVWRSILSFEPNQMPKTDSPQWLLERQKIERSLYQIFWLLVQVNIRWSSPQHRLLQQSDKNREKNARKKPSYSLQNTILHRHSTLLYRYVLDLLFHDIFQEE